MTDPSHSASNTLFSHLDQTEPIVTTATVETVIPKFSSPATDSPSPRD